MTITALTDVTKLPARTQDQQTFDSNLADYFTNLSLRAQQENDLAANLNSIAFGGAYAIPYTFKTGQIASTDPGAGKIGILTSGAQNAATAIYVDVLNSASTDVTALLDSMSGSTSSVLGQLRLVKQGDASKWLTFNVTSVGAPTGYRVYYVTPSGSSAASPFVDTDALVLSFTRTGDKGDAGSLTSVLWVRDEKASGQTGGTAGAGTFVTRTLNTIKKNSISGASVASNQITLPAGTYRITAFAPAFNVNQHQAYLYNVTDAVTQVVGTNAYAGTSTVATQSVIGEAEFVLSASKVFEVRHWTNTGTASTGLGNAVNSGQGEVFTQVFIEKVS